MKKIIFTLTVLMLVTPVGVSACAIAPFEREGELVEPTGLSQALIAYRDGVETLVLDPQLKGDAKDFGLAFAFPSRPEVKEGPQEVFPQLAEYTKPRPPVHFEEGGTRVYGFGTTATAPDESTPVTVIEEKEVGDYTAAVLQADSATALGEWLKSNGYQYNTNDESNFGYYVQKGGYFFVALKMTAPEALEDIQSYAREYYAFKPISFSFQTATPLFPSRLAKDEDPVQQFSIYALSKTALIVPGAATPFAGRVDPAEMRYDLPLLASYIDDAEQWLVKLDMKIDPSKIEHDLLLSEWKNPQEFHMTTEENPQVLFADQIQEGNGIVRAAAEELRFDGPIYGVDSRFRGNDIREDTIRWYEEDWAIGLFVFGVMLAAHFYIAAALFVLARRFGTRHRWRAWFPLINFSLVAEMAGKPWWWVLVFLCSPIIALGITVIIYLINNTFLDWGVSAGLSQVDMYVGFPWLITLPSIISILATVVVFLWMFIVLDRITTSFVIRCGRPAWWAPLSILVPPVGLVLLGVMAWSKRRSTQ